MNLLITFLNLINQLIIIILFNYLLLFPPIIFRTIGFCLKNPKLQSGCKVSPIGSDCNFSISPLTDLQLESIFIKFPSDTISLQTDWFCK
jgi:hypothetical protein